MKVNGLIDETGTYRICYGDEEIITLDTSTGRWAAQDPYEIMTRDEYTHIRRGVPGSLDLDPECQVNRDESPEGHAPARSDFTVVK